MKMTKEELLISIRQTGLIAVIRGNSEDEALALAETCIANGVTAIELTFTVPYAHLALEKLTKKFGDQVWIGAGTVLDAPTARIAILNGAQFVVSPHFDAEITKTCNRYRIASMAGIMTVTEAIHAMEAGVDILKLFPGDAFGPQMIRAIHGPLPQAQIMPTGGVSLENAAKWMQSGAVAVGVGSDLTKGNAEEKIAAYLRTIAEAKATLPFH